MRDLQVPLSLIQCIEQLMPLWKSRFSVTSGAEKIITEPITFKRGVFQGDSLSPLLFCISLLPISVSLRKTRGYSCGPPGRREHKVTHLFYMDDLKLYATSQRDLQQSLKVVQEYTRDVGMEFGLDKCATLRLEKGRHGNNPENEQLVDGAILRHLEIGETYRYLGIDQHSTQDANGVKMALRSKYRQRLRKIWESELSGINKVAATNMLAVPVLLYSFGVLKWTREELRELDSSTRKMMHLHRSIHPRSSVSRTYLPRHQGGRGLLNLECMHDRLVLGMACRVANTEDPLLRFVREHEVANVGAFLFKAAERAAETFGLEFTLNADDDRSLVRLEPEALKSLVKRAEQQKFLEDHANKPQHGVFYRNIERLNLSRKLTFAFLKSADLKSETEGFLLACQDGVVNTLVYRSQFSNVLDTRCRACRQQPETLMHLLSACPVHAVTSYIHRHNDALRVLYYHLRHCYGIDETPILPFAPNDIEAVVENDNCRIYWNYPFPTTHLIQANKPDIVLLEKRTSSMYVIEFSAPAETNIDIKEREKRAKYIDLVGELRRLYPECSVRLVVLVVGVLGGIKDTILAELRKIPACQNSPEQLVMKMQKAVVLGSLRLLRQMNLAEDH